ncbi:MAG: carboxylate--amine ligase, partial [Eggerthellaceae bacterium]|nr:carboxylate--amine ligase [Eggerthellaceae bacterium]
VFRVLSEPVTKAFLTAEEAAFIEQSIPFTTFLDDAHIDLDEVRAHKDAWIIKPTDHYGADEVHAGCYWDQESWDRLIARFANGASGTPFLVQEYCLPFQTLTLPPDTGIDGLADDEVSSVPQRYNNLLGLYLYDGRFAGVFSRLGPLPTICKDMQGVTAATIWVDQGDGEGKDG